MACLAGKEDPIFIQRHVTLPLGPPRLASRKASRFEGEAFPNLSGPPGVLAYILNLSSWFPSGNLLGKQKYSPSRPESLTTLDLHPTSAPTFSLTHGPWCLPPCSPYAEVDPAPGLAGRGTTVAPDTRGAPAVAPKHSPCNASANFLLPLLPRWRCALPQGSLREKGRGAASPCCRSVQGEHQRPKEVQPFLCTHSQALGAWAGAIRPG